MSNKASQEEIDKARQQLTDLTEKVKTDSDLAAKLKANPKETLLSVGFADPAAGELVAIWDQRSAEVTGQWQECLCDYTYYPSSIVCNNTY